MCFLSDLVGFELEDAVLEESELVSSMPVLANEDKDAPDVWTSVSNAERPRFCGISRRVDNANSPVLRETVVAAFVSEPEQLELD